MGDDLTKKVAEWLEKDGRALEMRVARAFVEGGAFVNQAIRYQVRNSAHELISREVDVRAAFPWGDPTSDYIEILAECKNSPDKSWVGILPAQPLRKQMSVKHFSYQYINGEVTEEAIQDWVGQEFFRLDEPIAVSIVTAHAAQNENNRAYDAVRQAVSAGRNVLRADLTDAILGPATIRIRIPIVVTTAPLFLADISTGELILTRTDYIEVASPIKDRAMPIRVMNEAALSRFIAVLKTVSVAAPPEWIPPMKRWETPKS